METAAIAQAAFNHGVRFAACRAISDLCAPDSDEFDAHLDGAAERSAAVVLDALPRLAAA
jgi:adenosylhomocysteine nucleosidase